MGGTGKKGQFNRAVRKSHSKISQEGAMRLKLARGGSWVVVLLGHCCWSLSWSFGTGLKVFGYTRGSISGYKSSPHAQASRVISSIAACSHPCSTFTTYSGSTLILMEIYFFGREVRGGLAPMRAHHVFLALPLFFFFNGFLLQNQFVK